GHSLPSLFLLLFCYYVFLLYDMPYFPSFFFSSRRRHTRSKRDWSSDVCSSDLLRAACCWVAPSSRVLQSRRSRAFNRDRIWSPNTSWVFTAVASSASSQRKPEDISPGVVDAALRLRLPPERAARRCHLGWVRPHLLRWCYFLRHRCRTVTETLQPASLAFARLSARHLARWP